MVAELSGQLVHHLLEDDGVYVEPEHVEEEPVPHLGLLDDDVDALLLDEAEADVEQISLNSRMRGETGMAMVTGMKGKDRELDGNDGVDMVDNYQEYDVDDKLIVKIIWNMMLIMVISNIRHKDFHSSVHHTSVTLRLSPSGF